MFKSNKKLMSLVVAGMYALCILVAAPIQAYAATTGTHVTAAYYSKAQKAAQTKRTLAALAKLPSSTTTAKYYDSATEYTLLLSRYKTANKEVYKAKNMGLRYKSFKNYGRLGIAKARVNYLVAVLKTIRPVVELIDALPTTITLANEAAVIAANNAYTALTAAQKKMVPNKAKLVAAVAAIAALKNPGDVASAKLVINAIAALPLPAALVAADEFKVVAAKKAYTDLNTEAKALVTNLSVLTAAETKIAELKLVAAIDTVTVTGIKTVAVKFKSPVDTTKAVLTIKRGATVYGSVATWNTTKDIATLTTIVNLPAADYSVEVTGLTTAAITKTFTVATEVASKIEILSTSVELANSAKVLFKVSNQYGEDMKVLGTATTPTIVVVTGWNITQAKAVTLTNTTADNKIAFPADFATAATPAKLADSIRVIATYAGLTATATLSVVSPSVNADFSFGTVSPLTGKTKITVSETGLVIPYTMTDQYSTAATLASHTAGAYAANDVEVIDGVQFISSNPAVVDVDTFAVDSTGKLTFATGATDGTAIITAVINASGKVASMSVVVSKAPYVDSLSIAVPEALVAAGGTVKLAVTAADQFGGAIAAGTYIASYNAVTPNVTLSSSATSVVANDSLLTIVAGKLNVKTLTAGTTVITAKVGTKTVGTVTIVVEAAAKATQVKSVTFGPKFEVSTVKALAISDLVVIDQYGRDMDVASFTVAEKTPADTIFSISGTTFTAGAVAGSSVMTLTANDGTNTTAAFEFTLSVVASADITNYAITAVPTIYGDSLTPAATDLHATKLELVGKTAAGAIVILAGNKVNGATSSDTSKIKVFVATADVTVAGVKAEEGTSVVALWNGATKLAETTITLSKATPVVTSVKFDADVETGMAATVDLLNNLVVLDQYGVAIGTSGFWTTSSTAKATVSTNGLVSLGSMAAGDTVTIGYVSANGIVATTVLTK